jgi:hypothetical protein
VTVNNNNGNTRRTTRVVTPPSVLAPGLAAAGVETCLGSASAAVSVMGGGFSFGSTTRDDDCNRRLYARQLHSMGYPYAAIALQCLSPEVQYAMAAAGTPCPGTAPVATAPVISRYASEQAAGPGAPPEGFVWNP